MRLFLGFQRSLKGEKEKGMRRKVGTKRITLSLSPSSEAKTSFHRVFSLSVSLFLCFFQFSVIHTLRQTHPNFVYPLLPLPASLHNPDPKARLGSVTRPGPTYDRYERYWKLKSINFDQKQRVHQLLGHLTPQKKN